MELWTILFVTEDLHGPLSCSPNESAEFITAAGRATISRMVFLDWFDGLHRNLFYDRGVKNFTEPDRGQHGEISISIIFRAYWYPARVVGVFHSET